MGLGKTVQTIAFLAWLNYQHNCVGGDESHVSDLDGDDPGIVPSQSSSTQRTHLIVVPASVLSNWMNEFKKFAPSMKGEHQTVLCQSFYTANYDLHSH